MAAAVGSLMMRITSSPAMNPASLVAWVTQRQVDVNTGQVTAMNGARVCAFSLAARLLQDARSEPCCADRQHGGLGSALHIIKEGCMAFGAAVQLFPHHARQCFPAPWRRFTTSQLAKAARPGLQLCI